MDVRLLIIELVEKVGLIALAGLVAVLAPPLRDRILGLGRPRGMVVGVVFGTVLAMWGARMGEWWLGHYFNVRAIGVLIAGILTGARGGSIAGLLGGLFYVIRVVPDAGPIAVVASTLDGLTAGLVVSRNRAAFNRWQGMLMGVWVQAPKVLVLTAATIAADRSGDYAVAWPAYVFQLLGNAAGAVLFVNVARIVLAREENARALVAAEAAADRLELQALRGRLEPHFLFNALNTLRATIRRNPERARDLVSDLADLYRYLLHHPDDAPLRSEVKHAEQYLAIERARLGEGRLTFTRSVGDDVAEARVPALLLQPLVENAVKHGVAAHRGAGRIELRAERRGDALHVEVVERHEGEHRGVLHEGAGIATDTLKDMLRRRYGDAAALELDVEQGGSVARVRIPFTLTDDSTRLPRHE